MNGGANRARRRVAVIAAAAAFIGSAPAAHGLIDTDPPTVSFAIDDSLSGGSVIARFSEPVFFVGPDNLHVLAGGTTTRVPASLSCYRAGGAATACATGDSVRARLDFTGTLVAGQKYAAVANPDGATPITDKAGNVLATARDAFRSNLSEQEESVGATFVWDKVSTVSAYGGSYRRERTRGARASLWFNGTSAVWYTVMGRYQGRAAVYVDGERVAVVNNYAPEARYRVARAVRVPAGGRHRLTIKVLGERGARAGKGTFIGLDGIRDGGTLDRDPAVRYRWDPVRAGRASADRYVRSDVRGARASFLFRGKGIDWTTITGPEMGKARIELDGEAVRTVDNYAAGRHYAVRRSLSGLTDTVHRLTIVVLGRKDRRADERFVVIDKWRVRLPSTADFRRLGAWVDLWDYGLDPADAVADLDARGVRTLYLQTARWSSDDDIARPEDVGRWIERSHAAGIKVIGWYLPGYDQHLDRDVRRTAAIAAFRTPHDQRFDALGIDIEYKGETESLDEFNEGIRDHLRRVRRGVGNSFPVGAIVPSPVGMSLSPSSWTGFPWGTIGRYADVVLPMGYWSYRSDCDSNPAHCPYRYSRDNIAKARTKTALPVHLIGGVGTDVTAAEVSDFVRGTRDERALGGSLYDYRTTSSTDWQHLDDLNRL